MSLIVHYTKAEMKCLSSSSHQINQETAPVRSGNVHFKCCVLCLFLHIAKVALLVEVGR